MLYNKYIYRPTQKQRILVARNKYPGKEREIKYSVRGVKN
jgi:hypothetical protein